MINPSLANLITNRVNSEGSIPHDKLAALLESPDTLETIHALYVVGRIGLDKDGVVYRNM